MHKTVEVMCLLYFFAIAPWCKCANSGIKFKEVKELSVRGVTSLIVTANTRSKIACAKSCSRNGECQYFIFGNNSNCEEYSFAKDLKKWNRVTNSMAKDVSN